MTVTLTSFRSDFPEFANTTTFPDAQVTLWLTIAQNMLDPDRWGDLLDFGTELFIAHNLVQQANAIKAAASGSSPGAASGPTTSKAVGGVSTSYDAGLASIEGAGNWNLTNYGTRFYQMSQMFGAGGLQL